MSYVLFSILAVAFLWLCWRLNKLENELETAHIDRSEFASLAHRIHALERLATWAPAATPAPATTQATAVSVGTPPKPSERPEKPSAAAPAEAKPSPGIPTPARREWEELIGGSVLNAVGAIVLVIGIALFLAYSFAHMTAAGRATLAAAASVAILAAGVWIEPRPRYRGFARGLIGAGWAALYATAYAIYALPAARIVPNPEAGSLIQLAVAIGMVLHSLRYRAQAVTAIAYSAVFAALAAAPSTPFAIISLVPMAASVLYLAARFEWDSMPLFGLAATYLTCIARAQSDASLESTQTLFLAYWLLFELFDLRRVKLGRVAGGLEFIFPLNALGFIWLSYETWNRHAPGWLWFAAACGSALFLASSVARVQLRTASGGEFTRRLREGAYEASLTVSALLAILAVAGRAPGIWAAAGIAVEAEILYLVGVRFDLQYVRWLGMAIFGYSLLRLTASTGHVTILGHTYEEWTPAALFHAALFYWNRALRRSAAIFSYVASALAALVLVAELPHAAAGFAWVAFGCALLQLGLRRGLREFDLQGQCLLGLGACVACAYALTNPSAAWWPLAAAAVLLFVAVNQLHGKVWLHFAAAACASVLLWRILPSEYLALAWAALALALEFFALRWPAYFLSGSALVAALILDIDPPRLAISIPTAALFYALQFVARHRGEGRAALYLSLLGTALATAILHGRISGELFTVAWGLLGLALLGSGFAARDRNLRLEGLSLLLLCILKLFLYDLRNLETIYRILSFVALGLILLSVSWIYSRFRDQISRLL